VSGTQPDVVRKDCKKQRESLMNDGEWATCYFSSSEQERKLKYSLF
jgi:hypothetical protein